MKISILTASLLATTLVTSALAVENIEFNSGAKLWYQTNAANNAGADNIFNKSTAVGLAEIDVGVKADLFEGLKGEVNTVVLDSLGLENDVVGNLSNATAAHQGSDGDILKTQWWVSVANLKYSTGNTSAQVGRITLNTPLLFTERWNAGYNTFEGAVLTNTDIPKTKLTAMYITGQNGTGINNAGSPGNGIKIPSTVTNNGNYYGFGTSINNNGQTGAVWTGVTVDDGKKSLYSLGANITPVDNLSINLWYYNISSIKDAYWADASYKIGDLFLGIQNSSVYGKSGTYGNGNSYSSGDAMITAAKVAYTIDKLNVYGAYSFTDDNADASVITNFATNRKSKVYTSAIVQDGGIVGAPDTKAWKVGGSYKFDSWKLVSFVQNTQQGSASAASPFRDSTEYDIVASTKIGKHVNLKSIFMHREYDETSSGHDSFDLVRLIASVKF
jgi:hypothetical protein